MASKKRKYADMEPTEDFAKIAREIGRPITKLTVKRSKAEALAKKFLPPRAEKLNKDITKGEPTRRSKFVAGTTSKGGKKKPSTPKRAVANKARGAKRRGA